jgi:hypothetical protein
MNLSQGVNGLSHVNESYHNQTIDDNDLRGVRPTFLTLNNNIDHSQSKSSIYKMSGGASRTQNRPKTLEPVSRIEEEQPPA